MSKDTQNQRFRLSCLPSVRVSYGHFAFWLSMHVNFSWFSILEIFPTAGSGSSQQIKNLKLLYAYRIPKLLMRMSAAILCTAGRPINLESRIPKSLMRILENPPLARFLREIWNAEIDYAHAHNRHELLLLTLAAHVHQGLTMPPTIHFTTVYHSLWAIPLWRKYKSDNIFNCIWV